MKIFIAEKGCVLLVEKLRGTLSCKQWLHGGEICTCRPHCLPLRKRLNVPINDSTLMQDNIIIGHCLVVHTQCIER